MLKGMNLNCFIHQVFRLLSETRYNKIELEDIKEIYAVVAETGAGLNLDRFEEFLGYVYNIPHHPLSKIYFFLP